MALKGSIPVLVFTCVRNPLMDPVWRPQANGAQYRRLTHNGFLARRPPLLRRQAAAAAGGHRVRSPDGRCVRFGAPENTTAGRAAVRCAWKPAESKLECSLGMSMHAPCGHAHMHARVLMDGTDSCRRNLHPHVCESPAPARLSPCSPPRDTSAAGGRRPRQTQRTHHDRRMQLAPRLAVAPRPSHRAVPDGVRAALDAPHTGNAQMVTDSYDGDYWWQAASGSATDSVETLAALLR